MEFLLTIALVAVVVYLLRLRDRSKNLTLRLSHLEDEVRRLYEQRERPEQAAPIQPVPIQPEARPDARLPPPLPPPVPPRIPISAPPLSPSELAAAPMLSQPAPEPGAPPVPPARPVSLEERLGARLPVWIGSIALALAGAFLVKYSFDKGLFSPTVRVAFGVMFGVGLLGAGEWMRRSSERVAQGLSAAGVAVLYSCFLAGVHLYRLIPPGVGFGLMALTTVVAVVLSLRQGIMVALIGMIGGFLTPYLVRSGEGGIRGLFAYLLLLQVGLLVVSRRRGWQEVGALSIAGGLVWTVIWMLNPFQPGDEIWLGLFLLLSVVSTLVACLAGTPQDTGVRSVLPVWVAAGGGLLAMALVAGRGGYDTAEWGLFGLIAAGTLVLARLRPAFRPLAWVATAVGIVLLGAWGTGLEDGDTGRFLVTAAALGALFAGGAYLASWGDEKPGQWGALSVISGLFLFLIAVAATEGEVERPLGAVALGIAALYLIAALPVARRRPAMDPMLASLAVAVTAFVSLAVPLELERQWLTVAWAVEVVALVWLAGRFQLPVLSGLARAVAIGVTIRLLLNASVLDYPIGDHPLVHWLWYGYGVPVLAFIAAAVVARRNTRLQEGDRQFATLLEAGALAFAFVLVTLVIRQLFHPGDPGSGEIVLAEWGALIVAWAAMGWGLLIASRRRPEPLPSLEWGSQAILIASALAMILGPVLAGNPLWTGEPVGETPVLNLLLWVYGVPAVLFALAAAELRRRETRLPLAPAFSILVLVLAFALVSLEVRQLFQGDVLSGPATSVVERWSYSAAWIAFGAVLLMLGVARRGKMLRYASLVVMLLVIGKVFLYDMANLSDLWRVFSFLGLGVSLLALAWVYQRFVFREDALR
jgi:uncharacterized membrane protein